jgi:hypothetical protein
MGLRINALRVPEVDQQEELKSRIYRDKLVRGLLPKEVHELVEPCGLLEILAIKARRKIASMTSNIRDVPTGHALAGVTWAVNRLNRQLTWKHQSGAQVEQRTVNIIDSYISEAEQVGGLTEGASNEGVAGVLADEMLAVVLERNYDQLRLREEGEIARLLGDIALAKLPLQDQKMFNDLKKPRLKLETLRQKTVPRGAGMTVKNVGEELD